jgi:hypothetical protein
VHAGDNLQAAAKMIGLTYRHLAKAETWHGISTWDGGGFVGSEKRRMQAARLLERGYSEAEVARRVGLLSDEEASEVV